MKKIVFLLMTSLGFTLSSFAATTCDINDIMRGGVAEDLAAAAAKFNDVTNIPAFDGGVKLNFAVFISTLEKDRYTVQLFRTNPLVVVNGVFHCDAENNKLKLINMTWVSKSPYSGDLLSGMLLEHELDNLEQK